MTAFDRDREKQVLQRPAFSELAWQDCTSCHGLGYPLNRKNSKLCKCVYRAVFDICLSKFREIQNSAWESQPTIFVTGQVFSPKSNNPRFVVRGRKKEEFCADFYLIAKRQLSVPQWKLFLLHFLLEADWKASDKHLKIGRGAFFHSVYTIKEKLGQALLETQPYPLYPIQDYFAPVQVGKHQYPRIIPHLEVRTSQLPPTLVAPGLATRKVSV